MFLVKCKCGKSQKNFKFNIGEFFIDECCEKAGFDHKGNLKKPEVKVEKIVEVKEEKKEEVVEEIKEEKKAPIVVKKTKRNKTK